MGISQENHHDIAWSIHSPANEDVGVPGEEDPGVRRSADVLVGLGESME